MTKLLCGKGLKDRKGKICKGGQLTVNAEVINTVDPGGRSTIVIEVINDQHRHLTQR